jgi:hypothetical protein
VELIHKLDATGARFVERGVHHYPRSNGRSAFFKPSNVAKTLLGLAVLWWQLVVCPRMTSWTRMLRRRRFWAPATALTGLFTLTWLTALRAPVTHADEAWFLWVAIRANHGARLYRDVYFVSTPLAMWLMQAAVWVFGPRVAVERALAAGLFSVSALLIWLVGQRLSVHRLVRGIVVLGLFVLASPVAYFASIYSMLAVTLSLAALLVILQATASPGPTARATFLAGLMSGLAFASKPNTGLLAILAVSAVVVARGRRGPAEASTRAGLAAVGAGCGVAFMGMLAQILAAGTFGDFVGNVFTGKTDYLSAVGSPLLPGFRHLVEAISAGRGTLGTEIVAFDILAPVTAVAIFAIVIWRTRDRSAPDFVALAAFTLVGIGAAAPDFGAQHLTEAMPFLLALPAFALARARPLAWPRHRWSRRSWPRVATVAIVTSLMLVASVAVAADAQAPTVTSNDHLVASALPHLDGQPISAIHEANVLRDARELRRRTGGRVFIVEASAAQFYLTGGLTDPTPYDFPARSDLGPNGETGAFSYVQRHHVRWICVPHTPRTRRIANGAAPIALQRSVRARMHFTAHLHACDLYRNKWRTRARAHGRDHLHTREPSRRRRSRRQPLPLT